MSLWDNVKKFTQPYSDDDYDDYDEDDYADDYDEPAEAPRSRRRSAPAAAPVNNAPLMDDEAEEEEAEDGFGFSPAPAVSSTPSMGFSGQVVHRSVGNKQEVFLFRPNNFNHASRAADELRNHKAVIVNLENVDGTLSRRVIDFLSGSVYALEGSVEKIAQSAYLFCPRNMDITGSLDALQEGAEYI